MAERSRTSADDRGWVLSLLPSIPIALVIGVAMASLGSEWRSTLNQLPTDPIPATGLFVTGIVSALIMVLGLALLVSMQYAVGAWVLAAGVGMITGVAIGFTFGADAVAHAGLAEGQGWYPIDPGQGSVTVAALVVGRFRSHHTAA